MTDQTRGLRRVQGTRGGLGGEAAPRLKLTLLLRQGNEGRRASKAHGTAEVAGAASSTNERMRMQKRAGGVGGDRRLRGEAHGVSVHEAEGGKAYCPACRGQPRSSHRQKAGRRNRDPEKSRTVPGSSSWHPWELAVPLDRPRPPRRHRAVRLA